VIELSEAGICGIINMVNIIRELAAYSIDGEGTKMSKFENMPDPGRSIGGYI